jgi:hypothetical protein
MTRARSAPVAKGSPLLTIAEAAEQLGREGPYAAQTLRRLLRRFEERTGKVVLVRVDAGRGRPSYRVQMSRLRALCPDLFDLRDPISDALRDNVIMGRRKLELMQEQIDELAADVSAMRNTIRQLHDLLRSRR